MSSGAGYLETKLNNLSLSRSAWKGLMNCVFITTMIFSTILFDFTISLLRRHFCGFDIVVYTPDSSSNDSTNLVWYGVFMTHFVTVLSFAANSTYEGSKSSTHYLSDKNRFDVLSKGPSSGISPRCRELVPDEGPLLEMSNLFLSALATY